MAKFEDYQVRNNYGIEECFYPNLGWITRERFNMPDIQELEKAKAFVTDPENMMNCGACPYNRGFSEWSEGRKPCGQFKCWVELHITENEEDYD